MKPQSVEQLISSEKLHSEMHFMKHHLQAQLGCMIIGSMNIYASLLLNLTHILGYISSISTVLFRRRLVMLWNQTLLRQSIQYQYLFMYSASKIILECSQGSTQKVYMGSVLGIWNDAAVSSLTISCTFVIRILG